MCRTTVESCLEVADAYGLAAARHLPLLLVLGALWGFYMLVLRPSRVLVAGVTAGFHGMARSLERTVELATAANAEQLAKAMAALKGAPEIPAAAPVGEERG